ncbi:MAG: DUF1345 domain-containing protein [Candidatus Andeanibacterium colombiense]|uniref:DUF1345 domain-containing protein n=1 Tax=Candidatus Andeanibacterium colombiense TaxID=3121345 RepID=A0AAJ6BQE8_9SPHN|nr:MAG: DUF1345 domain-containing protein [Sphingomonadaceae bacterium]
MPKADLPWPARIKHGRYLLFLIVLLAAGWPCAATLRPAEAIAAAFDIAALVFILSVIPLWRDSSPDEMRMQSERDDGGQVALLLLTVGIVMVMLVAVALLLKDKDALGVFEIALLVGTLLIAWTFSNLVFAFHYTRLYYRSNTGAGRKGDHGGLDVPGTKEPLFADFVNFSFVLGMTCQTADIAITGPRMRRVATVHGFVAFVFNLGILALTVNVVASSV